jgi:hypothetical protein
MLAAPLRPIAFALLLACAVAAQERPLRFEGEVKLGEEFRREIGHGLTLVLQPVGAGNPQGWTIIIRNGKGPSTAECDDFAWVLTPPYRGYNPRDLDTSYATPAREAVAISPREFQFVLNEADCRRESERVTRILWPYNYSDAQVKDAQNKLGSSPHGKATLIILDSKTSSGGQIIEGKDNGKIDWIKFTVEIRFPSNAHK